MKSQSQKLPTTQSQPLSAAIYARFSTDIQNDRSIDDQFSECRVFAERNGLNVVEQGEDRAKSSTTLFDRDGLESLLQRAKQGQFKVLLVDNLDRLSRDIGDLQHIFKRLTFYGVELRSLADGGVVNSMHIGVRGLTGALFMEGLKRNTRRGTKGRVRDGLFAGGRTYGYRSVEGKKGERQIDEAEAEIVRRIFREYCLGSSPRAIALGLTRDGIAPPSNGRKGNGAWSFQSIARVNGIIRNRLYIGELVHGRARNTINPETGKPVKRPGPASDLLTVNVPHLRIIDQALWDRTQAQLKMRVVVKDGAMQHRPMVPRQNYLLSGLLRCGACNGLMRVQQTRNGTTRFACATAYDNSSCKNRQSIDHDYAQTAVLEQLRSGIMDPDIIARQLRAYHDEHQKLAKGNRASRADLEKRQGAIERELKRLLDLAQFTEEPVEMLGERIRPLRQEQAQVQERLRMAEAERNVVDLHPQALQEIMAKVRTLCGEAGEAMSADGQAAFRGLVYSVVVHPRAHRRDLFDITTYGRMDAILGGGGSLFPSSGRSKFDKGSSAFADEPISNIFSLGNWRVKAA